MNTQVHEKNNALAGIFKRLEGVLNKMSIPEVGMFKDKWNDGRFTAEIGQELKAIRYEITRFKGATANQDFIVYQIMNTLGQAEQVFDRRCGGRLDCSSPWIAAGQGGNPKQTAIHFNDQQSQRSISLKIAEKNQEIAGILKRMEGVINKISVPIDGMFSSKWNDASFTAGIGQELKAIRYEISRFMAAISKQDEFIDKIRTMLDQTEQFFNRNCKEVAQGQTTTFLTIQQPKGNTMSTKVKERNQQLFSICNRVITKSGVQPDLKRGGVLC